MTQIERIEKMEALLDECTDEIKTFRGALNKYISARKKISELSAYYSSPEWMSDYDDSNSGKLPKGLKCGVLSEDAVFDLLSEEHNLAIEMAELSLKILKGDGE